MHPQQIKPITKAFQPPPLLYIQTSHAEIIVLQAALQHYRDYIRYEQELAQAMPLIQSFIQRLHDQLPTREDMKSLQPLPLTYHPTA